MSSAHSRHDLARAAERGAVDYTLNPGQIHELLRKENPGGGGPGSRSVIISYTDNLLGVYPPPPRIRHRDQPAVM